MQIELEWTIPYPTYDGKDRWTSRDEWINPLNYFSFLYSHLEAGNSAHFESYDMSGKINHIIHSPSMYSGFNLIL